MKKFIYKIIVFTFPLIFLPILAFQFVHKNHKFAPSEMYYNQEFNKAYKEKDYEVIVLGNSKVLSAIDKSILEQKQKHKVAVLGYSSSNISVSKLTLESYLNICDIKPKLILLEVSWFTFNNVRTYLHSIVGDLFLEDYKLWSNYFKYGNELYSKLKIAALRSIMSTVRNTDLIDTVSYKDRFKVKSPNMKDYKFKVEQFEVVFPKHIAGIDALLLKDFKSIVEMCEKHKIDLIMFTAPEDEDYSKNQKDIKPIQSIFYQTALSHSNIYYLNYTLGSELWNKKYEKWLSDSHHINENDLFTKELIKDMKARTHNNVYTK